MTFYRNRRLLVMRFAQLVIWGGAGLVLWLAPQAGRGPNDTMADVIVCWIGAAVMVACTIAYEWFMRLYVLRIDAAPAHAVRFTTLATLWHRTLTVPATDVTVGDAIHSGEESGVDTVHREVRVRGRAVQFIVDMKSSDFDLAGLQAYLDEAARAAA